MLQSPSKRIVFIVFCLASAALVILYFIHCIDCGRLWGHCEICQSIVYLLLVPCLIYWLAFAISAFAQPVINWVKTGKI